MHLEISSIPGCASSVDFFLLFMFQVCLVCSLQPCNQSCWGKTDHLVLLCVMFSCVFVNFPYGVSGQMWYLMYQFLIFAFFFTLNIELGHYIFIFDYPLKTFEELTL